jgi:transposase
LILTPGNDSDCAIAATVLDGIPLAGSIVMGDKAYGTTEIRAYVEAQDATYCIPPKSNAINPWDCDYRQYKQRHVVERFFNKIKRFRRVATRYEKLSRHFLGFALLAATMILLK